MAEFVDTPRGSFYVEQTGPATARTIMFVAGLGDDHASWDAPIEHLSHTYRCVTYDNWGIGRSPITEGPYSTQQMADDAQAIDTELGLEKLVAVGSSMGGAICQEWALAYPNTVEHLILSNTWGGSDAWFTALTEHWIRLAARGAGFDVPYAVGVVLLLPGLPNPTSGDDRGVSGHRDARCDWVRRCGTCLPRSRRPRPARRH